MRMDGLQAERPSAVFGSKSEDLVPQSIGAFFPSTSFPTTSTQNGRPAGYAAAYPAYPVGPPLVTEPDASGS
jgi:hypothetical protein